MRLALLGAAVVASGACKTPSPLPKPKPKPVPIQRISMDPVHFRVGPDGKVIAEFQDPRSLFLEADRLFREKKYEQAAEKYGELLEKHAKSTYRVPALYNRGLALEKQDRTEDAIASYRKLLEEAPRSRDAIDASFRLGESLAKLKRWREIGTLFTQLLLRDDLTPADNFEARVRRGVAHARLEDWDSAERTLLRAVRYHREASRREPIGDMKLLGQTFFELGEIGLRRMSAAALRLPKEQLSKDLNQKAQLLLVSQARYLRAIRTAHAYWAPAAGHQLGALYEQFHDQVMATPVPSQLNERERAVYIEELRKKVRPLIRKAVGIYKRNLRLSARLGASNQWVARTRRRIERLQQMLGAMAQPPATPATPKTPLPSPTKPPTRGEPVSGTGTAAPISGAVSAP